MNRRDFLFTAAAATAAAAVVPTWSPPSASLPPAAPAAPALQPAEWDFTAECFDGFQERTRRLTGRSEAA